MCRLGEGVCRGYIQGDIEPVPGRASEFSKNLRNPLLETEVLLMDYSTPGPVVGYKIYHELAPGAAQRRWRRVTDSP